MKTAVEWFQEQIIKIVNGKCELSEIEIYNKAKQIEKEQIVEAYCNGCLDITKDENIFPRETSEQYYNETFKSE